MKSKSKFFVFGTIVFFCIISICVFFFSKTGVTSVKIDTTGQPMIGNNNAPVEMIIFSDYKCPSCKLFHETFFNKIDEKYIKNGQVKVYHINFPFIGKDSTTAAIVGEAIYSQNKNAFWQYYDAVYKNQGKETDNWATPDFLMKIVKENVKNIDYEKLKEDIKSEKFKKIVEADKKLGEKIGIKHTPSIFINGKYMERINLDDIFKEIDKDLKNEKNN